VVSKNVRKSAVSKEPLREPAQEPEVFVLPREIIPYESSFAIQHSRDNPYVPPPAKVNQDKKHIWAPKFLETLAAIGTIRSACIAAGIDRRSVQRLMNDDPEFKASVELAKQEANEYVEDQLWQRGTQGVRQEKGIYGSAIGPDGKRTTVRIGTEVKTEYSDTAAIFVLKARDPRRYAEFQVVEHAGGEDPSLNELAEAMAAERGIPVETALRKAKELVAKHRGRRPQRMEE
jgi:hypothetical protein